MSKILVARQSDLGFVKVAGRGSFQNSGCFKAFYKQLLNEGVNGFVVDLGSCTYLDSTFLGVLLGLGLQLQKAGTGHLHILNASSRNLELLRNLGLDRLIKIESGSLPPADPLRSSVGNGSGAGLHLNGVKDEQFQEVACPVPTKAEAGPTILEAHEALMAFDPRNVPKFKDVVEFLREDLGQPVSKR